MACVTCTPQETTLVSETSCCALPCPTLVLVDGLLAIPSPDRHGVKAGDDIQLINGGNIGIDVVGSVTTDGCCTDTGLTPSVTLTLDFSELPAYANDIAAAAGGVTVGQPYQTTGGGAAPLNVAGIVMVKQP